MKRSPSRYTTIPISDKILRKTSLLLHIFELSTAVITVEIKVINGSLTQNQRLLYNMCNTALNAC